MIKKINNQLRIRYPLLWNTRAPWVLLTNLLLHLFFFLGGISAVRRLNFKEFSSQTDVGGGGMFMFSVLCSALLLILWCIFYLRNNAFKSFYRISKTYLAKEALLIVLIVLTSIAYPHSFYWGVRVKVQSITAETLMLSEINDVNRAMVFVPNEKAPYFILNNCDAKKTRKKDEQEEFSIPDTTAMQYIPNAAELIAAMRRPDAFSYANYCKRFYESYSYGNALAGQETINANTRNLLFSKNKDGARQVLTKLFSVLDKYGIDYRLNADTLLAAAFSDAVFSMRELVPTERYVYSVGNPLENRFYMDANNLSRLFYFLESCQSGERSSSDLQTMWFTFGYITLSLSVLLLCYRRFSRKVFLISVVGTLVWAILIGLIGVGMHGRDSSMWWLLLMLCFGFLLVGLAFLRLRQNKTAAGVLLNWHAFLVPYVAMLLYGIVSNDYYEHQYEAGTGVNTDAFMEQHYPFAHWVTHHATGIFLVNLFVILIYAAFVFNHWAKQWFALPEE